jgi:hypothetical protein
MSDEAETAQRSAGEWQPGFAVALIWNLLGAVLTVLGTVTFFEIYKLTHPTAVAGGRFTLAEIFGATVATTLLTLLIVVGHELLHGAAVRAFGARPRYGAGTTAWLFPYFYCTAPGHKFTQPEFSLVALAPAVLISALGAAAVAFLTYGGWLVVPLGIHLGGCIGDFWLLSLALQQPRGTLIEDLKTGVRFHRPAS